MLVNASYLPLQSPIFVKPAASALSTFVSIFSNAVRSRMVPHFTAIRITTIVVVVTSSRTCVSFHYNTHIITTVCIGRIFSLLFIFG